MMRFQSDSSKLFGDADCSRAIFSATAAASEHVLVQISLATSCGADQQSVGNSGNDLKSVDNPDLDINVHSERVAPVNSGAEDKPIAHRAADCEHVVFTAAEQDYGNFNSLGSADCHHLLER